MLAARSRTPFSPQLAVARRKIARKTFRRFPREMGGMVGFFLFIYWRVGKGATPRLFILFISFYVRPKRSPVERLLNFL